MRYSIRTVGPIAPAEAIPAVISLAEAKAHLVVEHDDDDALIEAQVRAAQAFVEGRYGVVLTPRAMELAVQGFPPCAGTGACWRRGAFVIPRTPVTAITAVAYTDTDGVAAELDGADWRWDESSPELVRPAIGTSWPTAYDEEGSVRIAFEAGFEEGLADGDAVAAVKLVLGDLYAAREETVTGTIVQSMDWVERLCSRFRRGLL